MRTCDLVQRLQIARRELTLESTLAKLDKYHLLILDDIAYVSKDQAETSVLFEYRRRAAPAWVGSATIKQAAPGGN
jgi:DNA replication protein DnaC